MATKLTRLSHKIAIQLHLVLDSCTICSSRSRRPVRILLHFSVPSYCSQYTPLYKEILEFYGTEEYVLYLLLNSSMKSACLMKYNAVIEVIDD